MQGQEIVFASAHDTALSRLQEESRSFFSFYAYFHVIFLCFLGAQLLSFFLFFPAFSRSIICAFAVAVFFFTLFAYFVLLFFFQGKKLQQMMNMQNAFQESLQGLSLLEEAKYILQAIDLFAQQEKALYQKGVFFSALTPLLAKCKVRLHWKNFILMKESLFVRGVETVISHIKESPLDLQAHTMLCEMYFFWSLLYTPQEQYFPWTPPLYFSEDMQTRFIECSSRAIEECIIIQELGSVNRWVLTRLAKIYELQGDLANQILQYETLHGLFPEDYEVLSKLGALYFMQGKQALGLKIYESLKESHPESAAKVLDAYSSIAVTPLFP